jgi:hypothetical protein
MTLLKELVVLVELLRDLPEEVLLGLIQILLALHHPRYMQELPAEMEESETLQEAVLGERIHTEEVGLVLLQIRWETMPRAMAEVVPVAVQAVIIEPVATAVMAG